MLGAVLGAYTEAESQGRMHTCALPDEETAAPGVCIAQVSPASRWQGWDCLRHLPLRPGPPTVQRRVVLPGGLGGAGQDVGPEPLLLSQVTRPHQARPSRCRRSRVPGAWHSCGSVALGWDFLLALSPLASTMRKGVGKRVSMKLVNVCSGAPSAPSSGHPFSGDPTTLSLPPQAPELRC